MHKNSSSQIGSSIKKNLTFEQLFEHSVCIPLDKLSFRTSHILVDKEVHALWKH